MDFYSIAIIVIFFYIFVTGFHDEGNLIATIIYSRSIDVKKAFILAAVAQFLGTAIISTNVSKTMAKDIVKYEYLFRNGYNISLLILCGLIGAMIWNFITWYFGIPSSSSHALIGGMLGPFVLEYGFNSINVQGILFRAILPLFLSPIIGFVTGYLVTFFLSEILKNQTPAANNVLKKLQYFTLFFLNAGQGSNDAQKGMGLMVILMMIKGQTHNFKVPFNIKYMVALMISLGLVLGGFRMIKSVGTRIYRVRPFHSFNAQLSSILVVSIAAIIGAPISGTQLINSSILGIGAKERPTAVRWQFARGMIMAWFITIPVSFMISYLIYALTKLL
ncbi:inorganic phosphate transporter [Thermoanaerobacter sp. CM-CNRG TB177]|jgi:PiT family inorganic phosphate transporter|uniref:inorganic phosphate transporter n=1 Tax=Thermoanaerobacter sp. CM-CNRG TB177 TaxID=2800659 RepID=UPI001BDE5966|nr:inorganic phosphate transporter [Thermoanaerobacter sp. CM-CNRG TB177]MBT1280337.1 inorganic phosphate transporter [Thermoanaerobacter sp. CM-CNRG TB177]